MGMVGTGADEESVERKVLVADVALGVALVAGAATAILLLTGSSPSNGRSP